MEQEFAGKTVLVTGAAGGMGRAVVEAFAMRGATVYAADRDAPDLTAASVVPIAIDVTDDDAIQAGIDVIRRDAGGLDILFNGAGIHSPQSWRSLGRSDMERVLSINVTGNVLILQAAAQLMAESGGGSIINVASITGRQGGPAVAYGASKAAVINFSQSAAKAYARDGIRVNAIAPGPIRTAMWTGIQQSVAATTPPEQFDRQIEAMTPLGRLGEVPDLIGVILLLASPAADHITGQTFNIDGGMVLN
jgi:NAD(P)-dependent dehydrogenase (short-subunit alcohol dehydrogenase family)